MTQRYTNPTPQYLADNGDPIPGGNLYFYDSGTTTLKAIYADTNAAIPIANPVEIDASGRIPNIFLAGSYKVVFKDNNDVQKWERDPVGGDTQGQMGDWDALTKYSVTDLVRAGNGRYYISIISNNVDNEPSISPAAWSLLQMTETWSPTKTYEQHDIVITDPGLAYHSKIEDNLNNNPDSNSDKWEISFQFGLWNDKANYSLNDVIKTDDDIVYLSLSNNNNNNHPFSSPDHWAPIIQTKIWRIATTYAEHELVSHNGIVYRSLADANLGNATIDGDYWAPAGGLPNPYGSPQQSIQVDATGTVYELTGPLTTFKNKLINPNFDIWQRGASFGNTGAFYAADRWRCFTDAGNTVIITKEDFPLYEDIVPHSPKHFLRYARTATGASDDFISQRIEGVHTLSGKMVIVSGWLKTDTGDKTVKLNIVQSFGTGGTPSGTVTYPVGTYIPDTDWSYFESSVSLDSLDTKVLGTNGDDYLSVVFSIEASEGECEVDMAQIQAEEGAHATVFEQRAFQTELDLCERYFEKSYDLDIYPTAVHPNGAAGGVAVAGAGQVINVPFKTRKRAVPSTLITYSPATGTAGTVLNSIATGDIVVNAIEYLGEAGFGGLTLASAPLLGDSIVFHWIAAAEV